MTSERMTPPSSTRTRSGGAKVAVRKRALADLEAAQRPHAGSCSTTPMSLAASKATSVIQISGPFHSMRTNGNEAQALVEIRQAGDRSRGPVRRRARRPSDAHGSHLQ